MPDTMRELTAPTIEETALARASLGILTGFAEDGRQVKVQIFEGEGGEEPIELPACAVTVLLEALEAIAAGRAITVVPQSAEITTVQAADILNVSRPFLIKLLDEGRIPHRRVGTHRRIKLEDLLAYKRRDDAERQAVLSRLVSEAQEQGHGY